MVGLDLSSGTDQNNFLSAMGFGQKYNQLLELGTVRVFPEELEY